MTEIRRRELLNHLVSLGAQFIEEAVRENPTGPIRMITTPGREDVTYEVRVGNPGVHVWFRRVVFGPRDSHRAGGTAFAVATKTQQDIASTLLNLMENRE